MKRIVAISIVMLILLTVLCGCSSISRGQIKENTYTNESIGVTFTKPSSWTFYTDEQIAQLMNVTLEMYKDKNLINSAKVTTIIDFMAQHATSGNNVNMSIENLAASNNRDITVEEYLEITKENINGQIQGMSYIFGESSTAKLGEHEYLFVTATLRYNSISMTQYFYLRKVDGYMISITATARNNSPASYFEEMFS